MPFITWLPNSMCVGIFGIVHNATYPLAPQFYVCRHIWHCPQCQLSPGSPILCVSAYLALSTMPIIPWLPNSMCVDTFGIVDNASYPLAPQFYACRHIRHCPQCQLSPGSPILCVSAHSALWTMPVIPWLPNSMRVGIFGIVHNANYPLAPQFYACRHIRHCGQCQLSPGSPILCVLTHSALWTMPIIPWLPNSMRVGI